MPWRAVYLTLQGIYQKDQGLRRAAYIIHCSLVEKPQPIQRIWPLPFDGPSEDETTFNRLKQRQKELQQWRQQQK